jgi:hypothetical protein
MKKTLPAVCFLLLSMTCLNAQVFNTSSTLNRGQFSAGFEPGIYVDGGNDFSLFLHGGAGINSSTDFGLKIGLLNGVTYIGGDIEFSIVKFFSISAGAHAKGNFGLDGTALITLPLGGVAKIYSGLDADIEFNAGDVSIPVYIPVGLEIPLRKYMLFVFESEVNVTSNGPHYLGGGLNFVF